MGVLLVNWLSTPLLLLSLYSADDEAYASYHHCDTSSTRPGGSLRPKLKLMRFPPISRHSNFTNHRG